MGFFSSFWAWLNHEVASYVGDNTARLASILEPAVVTCATLYVMSWGYLHLAGKIEEPIVAGLRRLVVMALVLGVGLRLWMYNTLIVDTFYSAPAQLAASIVGSSDPVQTLDSIWDQGGAVAGHLWQRAGVWTGDFGFYLAGAVVWCFVGLLCVYAMFLLAISSIASAVLLALGPLFVALALFDSTRRIFLAWVWQLTHFALVTILTVMSASLLLRIVQSYATQTAARGAAVLTMDALDMVLVDVLIFMMLRQVMPIASAIAGGAALHTSGVVGRASRWLGMALRTAAPAVAIAASRRSSQTGNVVRDASIPARDGRIGSAGEALARRWRDLNR
ncbi:MAG TPA: type IV secretion system protein [Vicinamibacterales bacterium]|jgi:type IV secretion system protein VirB6